jgi:hypothetical protein
MKRGYHGHPGPSDDHLPERVLGNVWSVLGMGVTHLRDQRCFKMVLVIFGNIRVWTEERPKSSDIIRKSFGRFREEFRRSWELNNMELILFTKVMLNKYYLINKNTTTLNGPSRRGAHKP